MASDFRPGSFKVLPLVIKNLLIINGLIWLAQVTVGKSLFSIEQYFALWYYKTDVFHFWQFLTYMFLHSPSDIFHLLFNMFSLWMFGSTLENLWGPKRFLLFYLFCGFFAGVTHMGAIAVELSFLERGYEAGAVSLETLQRTAFTSMMGASGGVMGVLAAFAYTFPNDRLFILPIPFPVKVKWFILALVAFDLFNGLTGRDTGVAHFAHLGGAAAGIILVMIWNKRNRRTFY